MRRNNQLATPTQETQVHQDLWILGKGEEEIMRKGGIRALLAGESN
jgi:hypothetical protein